MFFAKLKLKKKIILFIVADVILIGLSVISAFLLRFDGQIPNQYFFTIRNIIILTLAFCLPIFYFFRLYSFSWSYVSTQELTSLLKATIISFSFSGVVLWVFRDQPFFQGFPRSVLIISYFLIFILCGGIRLSKRIYLEIFRENSIKETLLRFLLRQGFERQESFGGQGKKRTLIVGAGDAGEQILRSIYASKNSTYLPIGFVDDNPLKRGLVIHGLKVFGSINDISQVVRENKIEQMIIALPSAGSKAIKKAVEMGRKAMLTEIKIIPPIGEIINGETSIRDLRQIQVEDLLGRETASLDASSIKDFISDKIVLITGAAGSIGSELSRQTAKFKPSLLLLLDRDETGIFNIFNELKNKFPYLKIASLISDIRDQEKINQIFEKFKPNIVFHAAAYKHVPLMEKHPDEAVKNNIFGTKIIAETALKCGVERFIFISTDKTVNPTSIMGATKRVGEMICQTLNQRNFTPYRPAGSGTGAGHTKFISVRFGNVLDSRGSVIPTFREQIKKGGPVEVTHPEMKRYFMVTSEAVLLVMQAGAISRGGEVFVLDMGEPIKILDLAKEMIKLSGFEPDKDIPIVFTKPRPGEKLFEEILTAEEGTIATQNQKIFMAKLSKIDGEKLEKALEGLKKASGRDNRQEIVNILKEIIPFYKPNGNI